GEVTRGGGVDDLDPAGHISRLCRRLPAAADAGPLVALCLVGESHRDRGDVAVLRGGVLRDQGATRLAACGATAGALPTAVGAGGGAGPQERKSRSDLPLDRGGGREQRSGRRAAIVPVALFAPARRPHRQGPR